MADLFSNSTGNFTTAATWSVVDSTSFLNSETNTTNTTTSFVSSSSFVPGAITIDGIAVKVSAHTNPGSGTFSVRLHDGTAAVTGTTVTINVTDMPIVNTSTNNGWVFMKFAAPVLLLVATTYTVQVQSSVNATVTLYRDATAANWTRALRTTTTQAPAAADNLMVMGEYISAASNNSFTVTMNETATTQYGTLSVSAKGTLDWGTAASTNYYLKLNGEIKVFTGGVYQQGTAATPIPSTSTALLEFVCGSNVQFGFEVRLGGTVKTGGTPITNSAFLASDAAAAATSLTTDVSTGWLSGDTIALASTTRTRAESESKALTANASGTTLTITALTNAHSGTSPTRAELVNLTRNVRIFSSSTSLQTYVNILGTSVVDFQSTEFYNMGSATALKRGIDVGTTTGSCTINNCSIHDFIVASSIGLNANAAAGNNYTLSNNVLYNIANVGINIVATTGTAYTLSNTIVILAGSTGISMADMGGTFSNLTAAASAGVGINMSDLASTVFGSMSGFTAHSGTLAGITLANCTNFGNPNGLVTTLSSWRNTTVGIDWNNSFGMTLDTLTIFGNATAGIRYNGSAGNTIVKSAVVNAGTTLTQPLGVSISSDIKECYIDSSTFGATTTHATADVSVPVTNIYPRIIFRNCTFGSATQFANQSNMIEFASIHSARHQQTSGSHKTFKKFGTTTSDTTIFNNASPSLRMTPSNATNKLQSGFRKFAVPTGQTAVVNVYVRKSVVGDGAAYNGNQPRLILRTDPAAGVTSDTVLATATNAANGAFELLTATTPAITDDAVFQIFMDCDGTAGFVNIDDWRINS